MPHLLVSGIYGIAGYVLRLIYNLAQLLYFLHRDCCTSGNVFGVYEEVLSFACRRVEKMMVFNVFF